MTSKNETLTVRAVKAMEERLKVWDASPNKIRFEVWDQLNSSAEILAACELLGTGSVFDRDSEAWEFFRGRRAAFNYVEGIAFQYTKEDTLYWNGNAVTRSSRHA